MGNGYVCQITGTLIAVATLPVIDPNVPIGGCDTLFFGGSSYNKEVG